MNVEKSCIQLLGKRKDTTFQIYCSPSNFLNLGKKRDDFVICLYAIQFDLHGRNIVDL